MGFKSLFKVRQPGNGDKVQKGFENQGKNQETITTKNNSQNSGGKTSV